MNFDKFIVRLYIYILLLLDMNFDKFIVRFYFLLKSFIFAKFSKDKKIKLCHQLNI